MRDIMLDAHFHAPIEQVYDLFTTTDGFTVLRGVSEARVIEEGRDGRYRSRRVTPGSDFRSRFRRGMCDLRSPASLRVPCEEEHHPHPAQDRHHGFYGLWHRDGLALGKQLRVAHPSDRLIASTRTLPHLHYSFPGFSEPSQGDTGGTTCHRIAQSKDAGGSGEGHSTSCSDYLIVEPNDRWLLRTNTVPKVPGSRCSCW
jgi:hypothetical protein